MSSANNKDHHRVAPSVCPHVYTYLFHCLSYNPYVESHIFLCLTDLNDIIIYTYV